jgi:hypothetical protein
MEKRTWTTGFAPTDDATKPYAARSAAVLACSECRNCDNSTKSKRSPSRFGNHYLVTEDF